MTKETDIGSEEEQEEISGEETIDEESYERTPILYPCLSDLRVDIHDPDLPDGTQAVLGTILSGKYNWQIAFAWLFVGSGFKSMMGRSAQALKPDLRDPDLSSRSMWSCMRFDTARSKQSYQIRINAL